VSALAEVFVAHAREGTDAPPDLEERLRAAWQAGRAAWPAVDVAPEAFVRHVAERLPANVPIAEALAALHAGDLYLACGCTLGDAAAIEAFENDFIAEVSLYLRHRDTLPGFTDEVKQTLRERFLVSGGELVPRIAAYNGRGPLGGWLRIATTWAAIDMERASRRQGNADALGQQDIVATTVDPEIEYLRTRYAGELREAVQAALTATDAHDATILRLFFLQGMRAEEIAKIYRVVPRTVRMWIAQARAAILDETRRRLGDRLHLPDGEAQSLLRLLNQDLDTSILHLLGER